MAKWLVLTAVALCCPLPSSAQIERPPVQSYCLGNAYESCFSYYEGEVEDGLYEHFKEFLENATVVGTLFLNGSGGDLQEALYIGRLLHEQGIATSIGTLAKSPNRDPTSFPEPGVCEGACAYMFVGGRERNLNKSRLGFPRFYPTGNGMNSDMTQVQPGLLVEYLVEMGVDARIFLAASRQEASGLFHVTEVEATDFGIATPRGYDRVFLEPYRDGVIAASKRLEPVRPYDQVKQVTFFCRQGRPHIMLTADASLEGAPPIDVLIGGQDTTEKIEAEYLAVRDGGAESFLTIQVPARMDATLGAILRQRTLFVGVQYARVYGGSYSAQLDLNDMDAAMVQSAFSHCIS